MAGISTGMADCLGRRGAASHQGPRQLGLWPRDAAWPSSCLRAVHASKLVHWVVRSTAYIRKPPNLSKAVRTSSSVHLTNWASEGT